jgi:hypothetical protein
MKLAALVSAATLAFALTPAFAATPMSEADCTAWMTKADVNADGSLAGGEETAFMEKMTAAKMEPKTAGTVSKEEFMAMCAKGDFEGVTMQ